MVDNSEKKQLKIIPYYLNYNMESNPTTPQSILDSPNVNIHPKFGHIILVKPENDSVVNLYKNKSKELYSNEHNNNKHKDSGLDLYCPERVIIPAGKMVLVDMGVKAAAYQIKFDILENKRVYFSTAYHLYMRSSAPKYNLILANSVGIIDSGYRGNLMARFYNISAEDVTIESGTRLVQICLPNLEYDFKMDVVDHLEETERGTDGLGSTGN